MSTTTRLDDFVTRVIAPNASTVTLDGTNTYLVGSPSSGVCAVIDPGPESEDHFERVERARYELEAEVALVLITHHHRDHSAAALSWAERWGCKVAADSPEVAGPAGLVFDGERQVLKIGSLAVEVVPTPGHCADHAAFRLENGVLFTGDHILGRGTSVVTWPEGNLLDYVESLQKTLALQATALFPGHGPQMLGDVPEEVITYYLAQRSFRESQIMSTIKESPMTLGELTDSIYVGLHPDLKRPARMSTRACLEKLRITGKLIESSDGRWMVLT